MNHQIGAPNLESDRRAGYPHSTSYDLFILVVTILALIAVVGLLFLPFMPGMEAILLWLDFIFCTLLFVDFLLSLQRATNRTNYFFRQGGWLDLLGSIPVVPGLLWTALFRLARVNRLVRIINHLRGKDRAEFYADAREVPARTVFLSTILTAILLMTIVSLLILRVERGASGAQITRGADAFWWAFVTMTTVGYGDLVPVTHSGRLLAILLMTFGIGVFAVMTSFMASRLVNPQDDREDVVALILQENAAIRAELTEIKKLLTQKGESAGEET
jgi:voltage-gated potassium channel